MKAITRREKFVWLTNRIGREFPDYPEAQICCAVVVQAIRDVLYPNNLGVEREDADSALQYLIGEIPHAEIWGVSSDWIRHLMERAGFPDDTSTQNGRHNDAGHQKAEAGRSRPLTETLGDAGQKRTATAGLS